MIEVTLFQIVILIFSVVVHEVSHGMIAYKLGDQTAKLQGRLTLNPLKHLDPIGSFIVPLVLILLPGDFVFGWAKPVPYNPYNLKDPKKGGGLIAAAGPLSNFAIAAIFGIVLKLVSISNFGNELLFTAFHYIIWINLLLAVFNLVPIPPLDGSKVLYALLPESSKANQIMKSLEMYSLPILFIFLVFGFRLILPIVDALYSLIT
ncbi:MAG: hypothetical protein A3H06_00285 [Candidatus Colwellbacteria bacterium RIFCSPLOWO2_12_FULL_44_13]|uniref:Peptidase M50 domain-containing protein n=3 Tax=Candidatus Colwelliibacteriota TaxID=1817904 RepID=A0A1G1Z6Z7_9BACT|nr:MAG: hypothetical protein A3F24_02595 [Candidatus Colwellbacteria bacterium RIFCSPHIGHO2_12_FULL_44_17]OGY60284.1 MAG: hypothetical protein A3I31_00355 [Candidatus Colwellbacteria bacterium RIFCSPLOWO2_02_FULL_44_20b]OGY61531.1 MAG: hypothetical protein A3H06_00285 [Candidatus Colwellbacteria bacterium RIFCSPLOWO2_12_FULL_44_13]